VRKLIAREYCIVADIHLDIIGDLTFGESFHNLELRRPHPWLKNLFGSIRIAIIMSQLILIPGMRSFLLTAMKLLKQGTLQFLPFASAQVEKRIKQGATRPDFMSRVLENNRDDGTGITRGEIDATSVILIIAGSETTATLLSGAVYLLLRNPDKLAKLRQEIDETFKSADEIEILTVSRMPYLLAVLEESLRVYPPVPISLPRITPKEGAPICGRWVPGGVSGRITIFSINANLLRPSLAFLINQPIARLLTLSSPTPLFRSDG
jgi:averantin hydroxylase